MNNLHLYSTYTYWDVDPVFDPIPFATVSKQCSMVVVPLAVSAATFVIMHLTASLSS